MSEPNGGAIRYVVAWSGQVQQDLQQLRSLSIQRGVLREFTAALRTIEQRLTWNPTDFGEQKNNHPGMRMVGYVAIVPPLVIHFGIHNDLRLVIPRSIRALPRSILEN